MKTHHIIDRDPNGLVCNFEVVDSQTKEVPDLIGTEPIIETFFPGGPGIVHSKMIVFWKTK